MAVKKIEIRPKGTGNYDDVLYPKTSADMVIDETTGKTVSSHIEDFMSHKAEKASLTEEGHVQLTNSVTSTSESLAATAKAVKTVMDRADAAFTSASNGKTLVGNAITGVDPNVTIPAEPTFQDLATAIGQINTGKKWDAGSNTSDYIGILSVSGLDFKPGYIIFYTTDDIALGTYHKVYRSSQIRMDLAGTSSLQPITINTDGFYFQRNVSGFRNKQCEWIAVEE